jgi:hypothetical protein
VQPDQIVVREVKRDRRLQVLQLLAEGAGEAGKTPLVLFVADREGREMMFTIEFFRIRKEDNAHAALARVTHIASDLEGARVKVRSLFDVGTLNMPQNPDGLRILDEDGNEVFFWTPGTDDS